MGHETNSVNLIIDIIIESAHLTYNAPRGCSLVKSCLNHLKKNKNSKNSRAKKLGVDFVRLITKMLESDEIATIITDLETRMKEIKPKKADPKYKKARYGIKTSKRT